MAGALRRGRLPLINREMLGGRPPSCNKKHCTRSEGWRSIASKGADDNAQIVFLFGNRTLLNDDDRLGEVKAFCPQAHVIGRSTSDEMVGSNVIYNS